MIAECYSTSDSYWANHPFCITITNDYRPRVEQEDNSPKAIRRRFQEFTRSLHKEAGFAGIRPAGRKVFRKSGARAREQRTRKTSP